MGAPVTTVTVRLYAGLRDLVGAREITMDLPSPVLSRFKNTGMLSPGFKS